MSEDILKLKVMVDELRQRVAQQEQKLLSLEREIVESSLAPFDHKDQDYQASEVYKEPILQRATKKQLFSTTHTKKSYRWLQRLGFVAGVCFVAIVGWLAYAVFIE